MSNFRDSQNAANRRAALSAAVDFVASFTDEAERTGLAVLHTADDFLAWLNAESGDEERAS